MKPGWKYWLPLGVGAVLLSLLAVVGWMRDMPTLQPPSQDSGAAPLVRPSDPQPVIVPPTPPAGQTADAARRAALRQEINRAIAAELKQDAATRAAAVASLRRQRTEAHALIDEMIRSSHNPEMARRLDRLDKELDAP
jgi:hypothetical protein